MGRNIFEREDNPMILFLLLVYIGVGVKLMYVIYYHQNGNLLGLGTSLLYVFLGLAITYGIITYHPLTYLISVFSILVLACYGVIQIVSGAPSHFMLYNFEGWWNMAFGVISLWLLWISREAYINLYSKSSLYR